MNASRGRWHEWLHANLSVNETKDACVFPSGPRPASRSNRPDTYQRLPLSTHNLSCETQPVHTFVPDSEVVRFGVATLLHDVGALAAVAYRQARMKLPPPYSDPNLICRKS